MSKAVKICGLTRPEDIAAAIGSGADFLGFIVEAKSPRRLSVAQAAKLSLPAKGITPRVAVTVNAEDDILSAIAAQMQPDFIQLHGDETPARAAAIKSAYGIPIIRALPIASAADLSAAADYGGIADFFIYDAKAPAGKSGADAQRGGHGLAFDWTILKHVPPAASHYLLAGGITPGNAANALRQSAAFGLDISSGVEQTKGVKDHNKIAKIMKAAHG